VGSAAQPVRGGLTPPELARVAGVSDEARALLRSGQPPRDYVAALVAAELYPDAVRFLAHAIPKREAVWWAWFCARRAAGAEPAAPARAALDATERWIAQPNDEHRRAAMVAAEAADFGTAPGCAALAAFLTGGSIAPPEAPVVPPGEFMSAAAVAGSVTLAAVATEPEKAPEKFRAYIEQGLDVARRIKLWEPAP
jgi:hypothetical protein